jgi:hypothetical protein
MRLAFVLVLVSAPADAEPPPWCGTFADREPVRWRETGWHAPPLHAVTIDDRTVRAVLDVALGTCEPGKSTATLVLDPNGVVLTAMVQGGDVACVHERAKAAQFPRARDVRTLTARITIAR